MLAAIVHSNGYQRNLIQKCHLCSSRFRLDRLGVLLRRFFSRQDLGPFETVSVSPEKCKMRFLLQVGQWMNLRPRGQPISIICTTLFSGEIDAHSGYDLPPLCKG